MLGKRIVSFLRVLFIYFFLCVWQYSTNPTGNGHGYPANQVRWSDFNNLQLCMQMCSGHGCDKDRGSGCLETAPVVIIQIEQVDKTRPRTDRHTHTLQRFSWLFYILAFLTVWPCCVSSDLRGRDRKRKFFGGWRVPVRWASSHRSDKTCV